MHRFRRHLNEPVPAATAVVLAVLVALAASISDGLGPVGDSTSGRVPPSLVASGRVLASALSTVAERLEEDWTAASRRTKSNPGPVVEFVGDVRARLPARCGTILRAARTEASHVAEARLARHLRISVNLPPPALACV